MSSFNNSNSNIDNLLLQTLMGRLNLRSPINNPLITQSLEDFLFNSLDDADDDDDDYDDNYQGKSDLAKEEAKLEREIIKIIHSGNIDSLNPNSGQAVSVRDHHICVGFHEEKGSDYRVWEWHGHIIIFDEEHGYSPEYIYGNYFQRVLPSAGAAGAAGAGAGAGAGSRGPVEVEDEEKEEKVGNLGLRELIDTKDSSGGRILHRNMNAGSPRY